MSNVTEKTIEKLMNKNMELEYENEILKQRIAKASYYMKNKHLYIGAFNSYIQPILDILEGRDKEKEKQRS